MNVNITKNECKCDIKIIKNIRVTKEFGINVVENCKNCCGKPCISGVKVVSIINQQNSLA